MIANKYFQVGITLMFLFLTGCGGDIDYSPVSDPNNWKVEKTASTGEVFNTVVADSEEGVFEYAFGDSGLVASRTEGVWTLQTPEASANLEDAFMLAQNAMWVVGSGGTIFYYDGASWTAQTSMTEETLRGVSALSMSEGYEEDGEAKFRSVKHAWAVGDSGTILHYDNTSWSAQASGTTEDLHGISMNDLTQYLTGTHGWAVGKNGTILFYDGTSWTPQTSGVTVDLYDVVIAYTSIDMTEVSVFAVGDNGTILHFDGTSWTQMESQTTNDLRAVDALPDDSAMAVGAKGTTLFYNATSWSVQNSGVETDLKETFLLVQGTNHGAIAVGADGSIIANRPAFNGSSVIHHIYISNDTDKGDVASKTWAHVINAGTDFGNRKNWPYWAYGNGGKIQGGYDPYPIYPGEGITLRFGHSDTKGWFKDDLQFNVIHTYDYIRSPERYYELDQRYCFQLSGNTCNVGNGKTYVSSSPSGLTRTGYWLYAASTATKVAQSDYNYADNFASKVCSWMGVSTSSSWGRVLKNAIKFGIQKLFGNGYYVVNIYYEVSLTNKVN